MSREGIQSRGPVASSYPPDFNQTPTAPVPVSTRVSGANLAFFFSMTGNMLDINRPALSETRVKRVTVYYQ